MNCVRVADASLEGERVVVGSELIDRDKVDDPTVGDFDKVCDCDVVDVDVCVLV